MQLFSQVNEYLAWQSIFMGQFGVMPLYSTDQSPVFWLLQLFIFSFLTYLLTQSEIDSTYKFT